MQDTNFNLSEADVQLLADTSFFEKKRRLFGLIKEGLFKLESSIEKKVNPKKHLLPDELFMRRGKISQGENLNGLPWMLLDYPAYFSKKSIFAFRTLFWWGQPLSMTLHLSGEYLSPYGMRILNHTTELNDQLLFCINSEQFIHHFEASNYKSLGSLRAQSYVLQSQPQQNGFIKIAKILPLKEADQMIGTFTEFCSEMSELMER